MNHGTFASSSHNLCPPPPNSSAFSPKTPSNHFHFSNIPFRAYHRPLSLFYLSRYSSMNFPNQAFFLKVFWKKGGGRGFFRPTEFRFDLGVD